MESQLISSLGDKGAYLLSLVTKKTYEFDERGYCSPLSNSEPLVELPLISEENAEHFLCDSDLYPVKPYTDLVITGTLKPKVKSFRYSFTIRTSQQAAHFMVSGSRFAFKSQSDKIKFTDPEQIDQIKLNHTEAYGGIDVAYERKLDPPPDEVLKSLPKEVSWLDGHPSRYPRNTVGKGYLIEWDKERYDKIVLPRIEDTESPLLPGNLLTLDTKYWVKQPISACPAWTSPTWFPRMAYFGIIHKPIDLKHMPEELHRGWIDNQLMSDIQPHERTTIRCANGAYSPLQLKKWSNHKDISLINIDGDNNVLNIKLPEEKPRMWVDGRTKGLIEVQPSINTVHINLDKRIINVVWSGTSQALRPYFEKEIMEMPYKVNW